MNYIRRPKATRWSAQLEADVGPDTIVVFDGDPYIETGLFDSDGWPIARTKDPIGFKPHGS